MLQKQCKEIEEYLAAYVDNETEVSLSEEIADHLRNCQSCAALVDSQTQLKRLMSEQLRIRPTPVHLRSRIRREIDEYPSNFGFWPLVKRLFVFQFKPAFAAMVVMFLFAGSLTFFGLHAMERFADPLQFGSNSHFVGSITCADCKLLKLTNSLSKHNPQHHLVVETPDGRLWNILDTTKGRELFQAVRQPKQRVEINGLLFPELKFVQINDFKMI